MSFDWVSYRGIKRILYKTEQLVGWLELSERVTTEISCRSLRLLGYLVGAVHDGEGVESCRLWLTEEDN